MYSTRREGLPRTSPNLPIAALCVALFACVLCYGCKVTLIGDYDDGIDKGVTDLQQTAEVYFAKLISTPTTPYDQSFHDGISARLAVLQSRAATLPKYTIITQQLANLKTQFDQFRQLDQTSPRPIGQGLVTAAQSSIETSISAILKLEIALKRTGSPP
jgi:hypothetical protein